MATVLITGCSSGFGLLTAVELVRRGHHVFASMRDTTKAGALRDALPDGPGAASIVTLDVTDDTSVRRAVDGLIEAAGSIDVVVNNAGIGTGGPVEETALDEVRRVFETNVLGTLRVAQTVLPIMRTQGSGHIVNVTSVAAFVAPPFLGTYAASKHAADAFGEALAGEVAPFGIHVTNVAPNTYATPMVSEIDDALATLDRSSVYSDRLATLLTRHGESMRGNDTPTDVAVAIADAIEADPPPARVVVPQSSAMIVEARGPTRPEDLRKLIARSYGI